MEIYLRSVRSLTIPDGTISCDNPNSLLVKGYQQNRHIFFQFHDWESLSDMWYLEGIRLLKNLESISVRCCPMSSSPGHPDVALERTEIHQIDGRAITVQTVLSDVDGWPQWDEPTMHLGDGSSVLDTIVIHGENHPEDGNLTHESLWEQTQEGHERARARLQNVRSLFFSGQGIFLEELAKILQLFPVLERFNCKIYNPEWMDRNTFAGATLCNWLCHGKHALIEANLQGHGVPEETPKLNTGYGDEDGMGYGADLRWLPYFRRCKKIRLPYHIRWVAEFGSEPVFPDIQIPSINSLEDVTLEIMDQRAVTPLQAKRVIEFIQQNITERTRITIRFVLCEDGRPYPVYSEDQVGWEEAWEMMEDFAEQCESSRTLLQS